MIDQEPAPERFFDAYPRFVETSQTGPWADRLNARYDALIASNHDLLAGSRVLDLASHDGRFSFASLHHGAAHVTGIEHDAHLVEATHETFAQYGVDPNRYRILAGDLYSLLPTVGAVDVVLCFGILYHLCDHMALFTAIADRGPRTLIIDTLVSDRPGAAIELRSPVGGADPQPGSHLEGYPTRGALEVMLAYFGWEHRFHDWSETGLDGMDHVKDYRAGRRVSLVVDCDEPAYPDELRLAGIQQVLDAQRDRPSQFITVTQVADGLGVSPQRLRVWVQRAERDPAYLAHLRGDA